MKSFPVISQTFVVNQILELQKKRHTLDVFSRLEPADKNLYEELTEKFFADHVFYQPPLSPAHKGQYDVVVYQFADLAQQDLQSEAWDLTAGKKVVFFRGNDISEYVHRKGANVYEALFKRADLFLSNSEFFKKRAIELGCPSEKIHVHRSGVDLNKFQLRKIGPSKTEPLKMITVGRLVEKKGIQYGIEAAALLAKKNIPFHYILIGEGRLLQKHSELAAQLGVEKNISFLGALKQTEIIPHLASSHLFISCCVTSSSGDQSGPDNSIKEAMAVGLPVIATDHGGIPEIVQNNINGFLVPEKNASLLAEKIEWVYKNPELTGGLITRARKFIENHYDLSCLANELDEILNKITRQE